MSWTDWFSRRGSDESPRPSLRDVTFDTTGLRVAKRSAESIEWLHPDNDRLIARMDRVSADHPLGPWTLDWFGVECRRASALRGGGLVSVALGRAGGIPIAKAISKFEDPPGYLYTGTMMIRFRDATYSVTLEAGEHGTTGTREAVVTQVLISSGELQISPVVPPATSAKLKGWFRDPYDDAYQGPILHSLSDDDRLDQLFPAHPLSKIRRWFTSTEQTLTVADDLRGDVVDPSPSAAFENETHHRVPVYALGILYLQEGRLDLAEPMLRDAIPLRDNEPVLDAPQVGKILIMLGVVRENMDRLEGAVWALEWAVRAFRATVGEGDSETIRARANLARVYVSLGRCEEAEQLLTEVLPFLEDQRNNAELAVAVNAMGLVRQTQNRHAEAIACFDRALTLFETLQPPEPDGCATALRNMAQSAEALGDAERGRQALARAESILRKLHYNAARHS